MKNKTVLGITLSKLIGLMIFLLILAILNIIDLDSITNLNIVKFLNNNLSIIIIFSILLYIGELFSIFPFPLNTPSPIFNALGGIFLAGFIFQIMYMLGNVLDQDAFWVFKLLEPLAYTLVFIITLIVGYIKIFINLSHTLKKKTKHKKRKR